MSSFQEKALLNDFKKCKFCRNEVVEDTMIIFRKNVGYLTGFKLVELKANVGQMFEFTFEKSGPSINVEQKR